MLTNNENYLRVLNRQIPEEIPLARYAMVMPGPLRKNRNPDLSGFDYFGVEYVVSKESGFSMGFIPKPGCFMIDDITKWRDIVKIPDWSDVDWEQAAKDDLAKYDRSKMLIMPDSVTGFFHGLINFMGFTEGLLACYEYPEEVKDMMETICDYQIGVAKNIIKYYKPDCLWLPDDICTARAPFVSKEMFEELFMPSWKRYVEVFTDAGIPSQLHCCGAADPLIDDFVECNFASWEAQPQNDFKRLKEKHGNKLAVVGGFSTAALMDPEKTEEEVRESVRSWLKMIASDGGYVWMGTGFMMREQDPVKKEHIRWISEEFDGLKRSLYA